MPRVVTHCPVEIWQWPSPEVKEGQLSPTPRKCSAGCLKYQQCVLEESESDIPYTASYHNTRCRTSEALINAAIQHPLSTMSPDSNPTIGVLQTDALLVSKDNFIPFYCPYPSFLAPLARRSLWFCVKDRPSNGRFANRPLCCKRR
ncbi:hypothetical protein TNCV_127811 [Trichonephila clavipes]|nr:hypothetical protein TNCV_127811 [Trichonephila clavipes]